MARRKITEEAAERTQAASDEESSNDSEQERDQLTQRMPPALREELDRFADEHGMSRNAAVNLFIRQGLNRQG
jgi:hypothetical protein